MHNFLVNFDFVSELFHVAFNVLLLLFLTGSGPATVSMHFEWSLVFEFGCELCNITIAQRDHQFFWFFGGRRRMADSYDLRLWSKHIVQALKVVFWPPLPTNFTGQFHFTARFEPEMGRQRLEWRNRDYPLVLFFSLSLVSRVALIMPSSMEMSLRYPFTCLSSGKMTSGGIVSSSE